MTVLQTTLYCPTSDHNWAGDCTCKKKSGWEESLDSQLILDPFFPDVYVQFFPNDMRPQVSNGAKLPNLEITREGELMKVVVTGKSLSKWWEDFLVRHLGNHPYSCLYLLIQALQANPTVYLRRTLMQSNFLFVCF